MSLPVKHAWRPADLLFLDPISGDQIRRFVCERCGYESRHMANEASEDVCRELNTYAPDCSRRLVDKVMNS